MGALACIPKAVDVADDLAAAGIETRKAGSGLDVCAGNGSAYDFVVFAVAVRALVPSSWRVVVGRSSSWGGIGDPPPVLFAFPRKDDDAVYVAAIALGFNDGAIQWLDNMRMPWSPRSFALTLPTWNP